MQECFREVYMGNPGINQRTVEMKKIHRHLSILLVIVVWMISETTTIHAASSFDDLVAKVVASIEDIVSKKIKGSQYKRELPVIAKIT